MNKKIASIHPPVQAFGETEEYGVILGPSGIGKGYGVGQVLTEYYGVRIFVTGDWCREFMTDVANSGVRVNDGIINRAASEDFHRHPTRRFLIDAPRSIEQAEFFLHLFRTKNPEARIVAVHISGPREHCEALIRDRATRQGRPDDACPKTIKRRMDFYFGKDGVQSTVVPFLRQQLGTNYHYVDGTHPLEHTRKYVQDVLGPKLFPVVKT